MTSTPRAVALPPVAQPVPRASAAALSLSSGVLQTMSDVGRCTSELDDGRLECDDAADVTMQRDNELERRDDACDAYRRARPLGDPALDAHCAGRPWVRVRGGMGFGRRDRGVVGWVGRPGPGGNRGQTAAVLACASHVVLLEFRQGRWYAEVVEGQSSLMASPVQGARVARAAPPSRSIWHIVPPDHDGRRLLRVWVPGRSARLREQAMLYALEDQWIGDIEAVERLAFAEVPKPRSRALQGYLSWARNEREDVQGPEAPRAGASGAGAAVGGLNQTDTNGAAYWTLIDSGAESGDEAEDEAFSSGQGAKASASSPAAGGGADRTAETDGTALPAAGLLLHVDDGWARVFRVETGAWVDWPQEAPTFVPAALLEIFLSTALRAHGGEASSAAPSSDRGDGDRSARPPLQLRGLAGVAWIEAREPPDQTAAPGDAELGRSSGMGWGPPESIRATLSRSDVVLWWGALEGRERPRSAVDSEVSSTVPARGRATGQGQAAAFERLVETAQRDVAAAALLAFVVWLEPTARCVWPAGNDRSPVAPSGTAASPMPLRPLPAVWERLFRNSAPTATALPWQALRAWRPAAALAVIALSLWVFAQVTELRTLEQTLRDADTALEARFAELLPGEPMIDPVGQLDARIAALGGGAGGAERGQDFAGRYVELVQTLDDVVGSALSAERVQIEALRFDRQHVEIELIAANLSLVEDLRRRFSDARLLSTSPREAGGVRVTLRIDDPLTVSRGTVPGG